MSGWGMSGRHGSTLAGPIFFVQGGTMLAELGCIALGVPTGCLCRRQEKIVRVTDQSMTWLVWVLLFLLGMTVGYDTELMTRLDSLGVRATLICLCAMAGGQLGAWLLSHRIHIDPPRRQRENGGAGRAVTLWRAFFSSIIVLGFFGAGVACGWFALLPKALTTGEAVLATLYVQLFAAGMCIGFSLQSLRVIIELRLMALLIPVTVATGSLAGGAFASALLQDLSLRDALAVSGGLSYYSLSSVLVTRLGNAELGSITLLANLLWELLALIFTPLMQRTIGALGPIAAGAAAAMDTCLPVIARECGERAAIVGMFSGVCLTMVVPLLLSALLA